MNNLSDFCLICKFLQQTPLIQFPYSNVPMFSCIPYLPTAHAALFTDTTHFLMAHHQVTTIMATCSVTGFNTSLQMAAHSRITTQLLYQTVNNRWHRIVLRRKSTKYKCLLLTIHGLMGEHFLPRMHCDLKCKQTESVMTQTHSPNEHESKREFSNLTILISN